MTMSEANKTVMNYYRIRKPGEPQATAVFKRIINSGG